MKTKLVMAVGLSVLFFLGCSAPKPQFSYSGGESLTAPATITFENESENAKEYEWDFGDGNFSNDPEPEHEYKESGNYEVTLKAKKGKKEVVLQKRLQIDAPERCLVELETAFGTMTIWLYDDTPKHRDNFLKLAEENFYDGLLFHRVIQGFMVQGGDPNSRNAKPTQQLGTGGPGYEVQAELESGHVHIKGALAAARKGDQVNPEKASSGSQFYLVQGRPVTEQDLAMIEAKKAFRYTKEQREAYLKLGGTPFLDRDYTVFGEVIDGIEIIDKIAGVETGPGDRPKKNVEMKIRPVQ